MARRKLPDTPVLQNWDDVDRAMSQIVEVENALKALEAAQDKAMAVIVDEITARAKPLQEQHKRLGSQIKQYVTANRGSLGKLKTKKLAHGETGFRQSNRCIVPKGMDEAVAARLEAMGLQDCVIVKKKVNKEQLKRQPLETVASAGARLEVKDEFWYDVYHADHQPPDE